MLNFLQHLQSTLKIQCVERKVRKLISATFWSIKYHVRHNKQVILETFLSLVIFIT